MKTSTTHPNPPKKASHPVSTEVETENSPIAPAGRALSFKEAKAWAMKKYDSALRELAK